MSCTNRYDVSLVCVYNKADLLEEMRRSAESSGLSIECIFLDNMDSSYSCAADALNEGVGLATAPVIVTLHQDVEFLEPSSLVDLVRLVSEGALGLYGIVGVDSLCRDRAIMSRIREGEDGSRVYSSLVEDIAEVATLDECLVAFRRELRDVVRFDSSVCPGWHLYAVDLCLQARRLDIPSFAVGIPSWHKSRGSMLHSAPLANCWRENTGEISPRLRRRVHGFPRASFSIPCTGFIPSRSVC
ncbi:MAG: glycosyltransferase [Paratractidigestivibacter faecalis]